LLKLLVDPPPGRYEYDVPPGTRARLPDGSDRKLETQGVLVVPSHLDERPFEELIFQPRNGGKSHGLPMARICRAATAGEWVVRLFQHEHIADLERERRGWPLVDEHGPRRTPGKTAVRLAPVPQLD
jgi:hypothetical protein